LPESVLHQVIIPVSNIDFPTDKPQIATNIQLKFPARLKSVALLITFAGLYKKILQKFYSFFSFLNQIRCFSNFSVFKFKMGLLFKTT